MIIFKEKTVVVTWATSETGRSLCKLLVNYGANVIATDVDKKGLLNTVNEFSSGKGWIPGHRVDVSNRYEFFQFARKIIDQEKIIDYFFNNAEIFDFTSIDKLSIADS